MILYHLDRLGTLEEGQIVSLNSTFIDLDNYSHIAENLFEGKLSRHGLGYLSFPITKAGVILEWVFEYVRIKMFSHRPSRFQSFFAFLTIDEAREFASSQQGSASKFKLWKIEADPTFIADIRYLHNNTHSGILTLENAHQYWSGKFSDSPRKEVLLEKFTVLEEISLKD